MTAAAHTVGINLRRLRLARGLSLVELGRLSGLAKGTLTQLEAGRANPTIETLEALSSGLGAELADLVATPPLSTPEVVRADAGQITPGRVLEGRLINRTDTGAMIVELFELRLSPGPPHRAQSHAAGVVEQLFVLGGTVSVGPEGDEVLLQPGDFVRFPADRPHSYAAPDGEARALMWQLLPTMPAPASSLPTDEGALASIEGLVPRGPVPPGPGAPAPPRPLPQPPVRGRRPPSRTVPGPRPDRPRPPGPGS
ncbi:helix-turn-helix domain-containing protein [Patulibacter sp.]|uniref:helix-turn-helix domain-containing protein n=1 Tax=Patulibacter sp. TaxID=1912859 RepID=UPI002717CA50|nr:XRE family transcriptional regulator [Patulibacter sp.]MDO9407992.1 XRE family transcriptional regulator [Patulibacter sp.]